MKRPQKAGSSFLLAESPPQIQLTRQEPEVEALGDQEEWFFDHDKLGRYKFAASLAEEIVANVREVPLAISLDGEWGTGKTFFLRRWGKYLERQGIRATYYNAWSDDDSSGDPLVPLLEQVRRCVCHFDERLTKDDDGLAEKAKELKRLSRKLAKYELRSASIGFTLGLHLNVTWGRKWSNDTIRRDTRDDMTRTLGEITSMSGSAPFVLIIDELDRCRPDYAIRVLERIKHLLVVPRMVFVYGINRRELRKSIASLYGDIDADGYIRRFFDMEFTLPPGDSKKIKNYVEWLLTKYRIAESADITGEDFKKGARWCLTTPIRSLFLSLRDVEHCIRIAALVANRWELKHISIIDQDGVSLPNLYAAIFAIIVGRLKNENLYRRFCRGEDVVEEMLEFLNVQDSEWQKIRQIRNVLTAMLNETSQKTLNYIITLIELVSRAEQ